MSYASTQDELAEHVRVQVAVGHADVGDIVEEAASMFEVEEATVRPLAEAAWAAAEADTETWPDVTDCDRLDTAFAALDRAGIRARQHFACCNTCGHHEMTDDIQFARELRDAQIDGYVFYHRQDSEAAVTDGVLHLRYATLGDDDAACAAIGRRVEAALRAAGLAPTWEGDTARTIQLRAFRWQRGTWPDEVEPPIDMLDAWCTAFERTAPSELVASLGEPFLHALEPALAVRFARAASTSSLAPAPRAHLLGILARRTGDAALWHEAFVCCPLTGSLVIELLLEADLADPALRELVRLQLTERRRNALALAAMAWFAVRTNTAGEHLHHVLRRQLAADEHAPSAKLAIRAALWALGDDTMRAPLFESLANEIGIDAYVFAATEHAAELRGYTDDVPALGGPPRLVFTSIAEAEAHVATLTEGYDEGLYTAGELEAARYELALLQGDLAGLAARYRDEQRAIRADLRAHLVAVRDGATPRIVTVDPAWLAGSREKTIQRNVAKWQAATTRDERRRERRPAERALLAATSIASVDHDRAVALVDAILDDKDTDLLGADVVIPALLAIDRLDDAVALVEDGCPGCTGLGPLITALALAGELDAARTHLVGRVPYLDSQANLQTLATAVLAVADDRVAAVTAMLAGWDRAEATTDALIAALDEL
jgi:hypothetical protein